MIMSSRTIWSDNGTLKDISVEVGKYNVGTKIIPIVASEDFIYIGSDFPFNHRYIDIVTANDQASSISVALWDGDSWVSTSDLIDQTSLAGVTLAQSGILSFVKATRDTWGRESTNNEGDQVQGLTGINILNLYWARLTFTGDLKATTEIKYIGHKFSDDNLLGVLYPDLVRSEVLVQFKTGKTSWLEQHIQAAQDIISDLKNRNIIKSENQILDWEQFSVASVHRVAMIAFNAFGKDFLELKAAAEAEYKKELNKTLYNIDLNNNATLDPIERVFTQGTLYR